MQSCCQFWFRTIYISILLHSSSALNSVWQWKCVDSYCEKTLFTKGTEEIAQSLPVCRLLCSEYAAIWPKPTGTFSFGNNRTVDIINAYDIKVDGYEENTPSTELFQGAVKIFEQEIIDLFDNTTTENGKPLRVHFHIKHPNISHLTLDTNEGYTLNISKLDDSIEANIRSSNFFGARHALTTLAQLIVLDDLRDDIVILSNVFISDAPAYHYRGLLLDTARSYIDIKVIKSILRGMGISKLNTFHWHLTDSQSFPFESTTYPELSKYGAYSPKKVYTPSMIRDLVDYATVRGIRILPEFDSPAHVGEGWQNTGYVTCLNWEPYINYCLEAPCGQFDPTQDGLYSMLGGIYGDLIREFQLEPDVFHIGGDEVNTNCWKSTDNIVKWMKNNSYDTSSIHGFIELRSYYLNKSVEQLYQQVGQEIPLITWQSSLTNPLHINHLSKERYIIQIWQNLGILTKYILLKGFKIIISNFDAMYLDCGFGSWNSAGNSYCSYNSWKKIYDNTPDKIAGKRKNQVLGSEVAFWTEQGGSAAAETRIWPRAAAAAEVAWSEPDRNTWPEAEQRFLVHRERLIQHGIQAESVEMEWCLQNEDTCRLHS